MRAPNCEKNPDKHIRYNPRRQFITVHRDGAVPEQTEQGPGIWSRDGGEVDECRQSAMTPVRRMEVDEVGDEEYFRAPEVVARPEEDPDEDEEVVEHEVGCDVGDGCD